MKILVYDVENAPNVAYTWAKYDQNVLAFEREWHMMSFAYKWLGEKTTHVVALPDFKLYAKDPHNDLELIKALYQLFDEADVLIAHNGDRFDQRKANAKFIEHGLTPPSQYKSIDTLKVARKNFMFNSNKLDDLGKILGVGRKVRTGGFDLWLDCLAGDKKAWAVMKKYNKQDVVLLEQVYYKLLPWIVNHPNMALMNDKAEACPNCGSNHLQRRGQAYSRLGVAQKYQCVGCGAWHQGRKNVVNKDLLVR